jgi:hypothetical protein
MERVRFRKRQTEAEREIDREKDGEMEREVTERETGYFITLGI